MPNRKMKINAKHIGGASLIEPLYIVASQLKTLMAEGIATVNVKALKIMPTSGDWPLTNM